MDEHEEGGSVANVTESTVTASEPVAGESETLAVSMACEVQGQAEGSFSEEEVVEGGGACNGDDIMVEVLGSRVYVDGICTSDGGVGENPNDEGVCARDESAEVGLETAVRSLEGEVCVVDDSGSRGIGDSGGEASSNLTTDSGFEGPPVVGKEGFEEKLVDEKAEGGGKMSSSGEGEVINDTALQEIGVKNDEGMNGGNGAGAEGSPPVPVAGETQVVNVEEVKVGTREECLVGELVKEGADRDIINMEKITVVARDEGLQVELVKEGVDGDIANVKEVTVVARQESLERELIMEDVEGDVANVEEVTVVAREEGLEGESVKEGVGREIANVEAVKVVAREEGLEGESIKQGVEREIANVEEVTVVAREEVLEGELVTEGVERVIANVDEGTVAAREDGLEGESVKEGVERDIASVGREQVLCTEEVAATASEDGGGRKLIEKGAEQCSDMGDDGRVELQELKVEKVGVLDDEVWNPGIENAVPSSSAVVEASNVETVVVGEEAAAIICEVGSNPNDDGPGNNSLEGIVCSSNRNQTSAAKTVCGGTEQDSAVNTGSKEITHVTAGGKDVEEGMEIDAVDRNLSCAAEEQLEKVEAVGGSTKNSDNISTDPNTLHQQTEAVVGAEAADMDGKELPSLGKDQQLKLEECLDQGTAPGLAQVDSNTEQEMEIDKRDAEQQQGKAKTIINSVDDIVSADSKNSDQSIQEAVRGNVQHIKAEMVCAATEIDSQVIDRVEEVAIMESQEILKPNIEVQEPAERNEQLKLDECLDKSAAHQVDPNTVEEMEIEKQVTDAEQLSLRGNQDVEVEEQLVKVETVGSSTENHGKICEDSVSLGYQTHVVAGAEGTAIYGKIPNEASYSADLEGLLYCSGNDQNLKAETACGSAKVHTQVMEGGEVLGPAEGGQEGKAGECSEKVAMNDFSVVDPNIADMQGEDHFFDAEHFCLHEGQETEVEEQDTESKHPETSNEEIVKQAASEMERSVKVHQASYQLPLEDEGEFSVSDLVWGKVRSHPWWPGQIFDPSDASEKATKYHKKDCFLVAYFGDRTFAWNEASLLKHFRTHFSQIEKQSNSDSFHNAVNCALEEVSRRIELGLACSCIPEDAYDKMRFQIVENSGIQQESSMRDGLDNFVSPNSFEPNKLAEYVKALAQSPSGGADWLDLVIAKAQLLAFYRLKGYDQLPEFQFCGTLLEKDANTSHYEDRMHLDDILEHETPAYKDSEQISTGQESLGTRRSSYHRRKHNLKDGLYHSKRERSLSDLMGDTLESPDGETVSDEKFNNKLVSASSGKKRKAVGSVDDDSLHEGRKTISLAKVSVTTPPIPKPTFKIGECIRRAASQMTGSPSILKCSSDAFDVSFENSEEVMRKGIVIPPEYSSLDDLLSQLHLAARDPLKGYSFLNIIIGFFSDFRNSIVLDWYSSDKAGGKRKRSSNYLSGSPEAFEFEDMNDTYWTDRVVQNGSEEQPSGTKEGHQIVPVDLGKSLQKSRRPYSRKRYSDSNRDLEAEKPPGYVDENSPAELIMNFSEMDTLPSETNLNKMFRHFGPIKESETEVDRETSRARVVFKKCSDAEVAFNSAGKFNIFGPVVVSYQLNYSISELFKISPIAITIGGEEGT